MSIEINKNVQLVTHEQSRYLFSKIKPYHNKLQN